MEYKKIVQDILSTPEATVIILFGVDSALEPILFMIQDHAGNRSLQFVASDSLASSINEELNKVQRITQPTFFFNLPTGRVDGFTEYFLNLSMEGNKRNPWFKDFFATFMNCTLGYPSTHEETLRNSRTKCDPNQTLANTNYASQVKDFTQSVPLVVDAVYTFAHALNYFLEECERNTSLCVDLNKIPGNQILAVLREQVFPSPSGTIVNYTNAGDVMG